MKHWMIIGALALLCCCKPETSPEQKTGETATATGTEQAGAAAAGKKAERSPTKASPALADYCNNRYAYCLSYPKDLVPQPESGNGDGRIFTDKNGKEVLRVYGTAALDMDGNPTTLKAQYQSELKQPGRKITYKTEGKGFYVISGYENGHLFYQKTISNSEGFCYAILTYSEDQRSTYDPLCAQLFGSFK